MEPAMPKNPRTFLPAAVVSLACLLPVAAAQAAGPDHTATFERLKALAGTWNGHMEDPLDGPPITVRYEVASNGNAVIEYQNPGQSYEMITVYYLAGDKLRATHYCAAGNQPAFRLDKNSTDDLAILEFDGGTGFDPGEDGHVHSGEIRFLSPDRIEQRWFHFVGPKELGSTHWFLQRQVLAPVQPDAPAPPPAPVVPNAAAS
jgi:hypothetical protein